MPSSRVSRRGFLATAWFPFIFFRKRSVRIAETRFRIVRKGADRRHYLWVHGNEVTARDVLLDHMKQFEGRAFLIENAERNIPINGGVIDPNRMFSDVGAYQSLRNLNAVWPDQQVSAAVSRLADDRPDFLETILPRKGRLIVALHNNSASYSVNDEVPISDNVSLNNAERPHEFMLCTQQEDFDRLSQSKYNVVLQHKVPPVDDGSLSRLAAARGVRYVNIEAALGNATDQIAMLNWVEKALP